MQRLPVLLPKLLTVIIRLMDLNYFYIGIGDFIKQAVDNPLAAKPIEFNPIQQAAPKIELPQNNTSNINNVSTATQPTKPVTDYSHFNNAQEAIAAGKFDSLKAVEREYGGAENFNNEKLKADTYNQNIFGDEYASQHNNYSTFPITSAPNLPRLPGFGRSYANTYLRNIGIDPTKGGDVNDTLSHEAQHLANPVYVYPDPVRDFGSYFNHNDLSAEHVGYASDLQRRLFKATGNRVEAPGEFKQLMNDSIDSDNLRYKAEREPKALTPQERLTFLKNSIYPPKLNRLLDETRPGIYSTGPDKLRHSLFMKQNSPWFKRRMDYLDKIIPGLVQNQNQTNERLV